MMAMTDRVQELQSRAVPSNRDGNSHGFTLIEVMVGFLLAALLFVGMNQFWVVVAGQIDELTLRQKAIFRINAEMERLMEIFRLASADDSDTLDRLPIAAAGSETSTGYDNPPADWSLGSYLTAPADRFIYTDPDDTGVRIQVGGTAPADITTNVATPADDDYFLHELDRQSDSGEVDRVYRLIFFFDNGNADRNVVWLDRSRNIVGQISWSFFQIPETTTSGARPCHVVGSIDACYLVTMYLDFPLRFQNATNPLEPMSGFPVNTITLQTILGAR